MPVHRSTRIAIALAYFLAISTLFFLPGSAFPKDSWLDAIYFDKWVHIGLFAAGFIAWCWALQPTKLITLILFILLSAYGYIVELIQETWILNRSFDAADIVADVVGNLVGLIIWKWWDRGKK